MAWAALLQAARKPMAASNPPHITPPAALVIITARCPARLLAGRAPIAPLPLLMTENPAPPMRAPRAALRILLIQAPV